MLNMSRTCPVDWRASWSVTSLQWSPIPTLTAFAFARWTWAKRCSTLFVGQAMLLKGQKVPVAQVGATLHPTDGEPFKIKKGKIRGEVSLGMICAKMNWAWAPATMASWCSMVEPLSGSRSPPTSAWREMM